MGKKNRKRGRPKATPSEVTAAGRDGPHLAAGTKAAGRTRFARWDRICLAAVVAVALLVYVNSISNGLVYDGRVVLTRFEAVRDPFALRAVLFSKYRIRTRGLEGEDVGSAYRPLTVWSFAWTYRVNERLGLAGKHPLGHHLLNVLLFGLVSGLLFVVSRTTLRAPRATALGAALLFAVHPIHTEVVAGIVGRSELLATLFGLLLLRAHARGAPPWKCGAIYALALLGKESAIGFATATVAYDLLLGDKSLRGRLPTYGVYLGVGLLWWFGLRATAISEVKASLPSLLDNALAHVETWPRILTALRIQLDYLMLQVFPGGLSADYSFPQIVPLFSLWNGRVFGFLAVLLTSLALSWRWRRTRPRVAFAVLCYAFLFAPTSNLLLPIGTIMGERLAFAPSIFFCLLVGEGFGAAKPLSRPSRTVAVCVVCAFAVIAIRRNHVWADPDAFMQAMVEDAPLSARPDSILGVVAWHAGEFESALTHFRRAHELVPGREQYRIARCLEQLGRNDEAIEALASAEPGLSPFPVRQRLVKLLVAERRLDEAQAVLALLDPNAPELPELRALLDEAQRAEALDPEREQHGPKRRE